MPKLGLELLALAGLPVRLVASRSSCGWRAPRSAGLAVVCKRLVLGPARVPRGCIWTPGSGTPSTSYVRLLQRRRDVLRTHLLEVESKGEGVPLRGIEVGACHPGSPLGGRVGCLHAESD